MFPSCTLFTAPVPKEQTMELREAIRQIDVALEGLDDISDARTKRGARKYGIDLTEMTVTLNLTKVAEGTGNVGAGASAIPLNPGAGTVSVAFTEKRSVTASNTLVLKLTKTGAPKAATPGISNPGDTLFNNRGPRE